MTKVKICGITNLNDAKIAVDYGADAIGFVFAESVRNVSKEKARSIVQKLPPFVTAVGLFVNENAENIEATCRFCGLDVIQLHGNERPGILNKLKNFKTIKAFRIRTERDITPIKRYKPNAILLDGYSENQMGGTGTSFDWRIIKKVKTSKPIIIAGGLTHLNVSHAIKIANPYGVDVSSGVESKPGKKDRKLIKKFIDAVKGQIITDYGSDQFK
ncbi:MAG: N-(5'-phosphoribosyl)anthranilate isomerase [Candidatus Scalindua rubra]|uniref:N-(5'-phosphoribosyl)anthranilate isomerase n=1 Tax=Candidatus Scalindua rubra TaxID=1872076 RepID=A0A1E3XF53_9BACT|nr:MAG: N-(5'-phosphoribosyl)anthranilate isomerase [Candidatus Scalindua rubra]